MLALPTLDHEARLLVRADRGDVRRNRLKVNPAEVVTRESELDELDDGYCADAATTGVSFQADAHLGVPCEQVEVEQRRAAHSGAVDVNHEGHGGLGAVIVGSARELGIEALPRQRARRLRIPLFPGVQVSGDLVQEIKVIAGARPQRHDRRVGHSETVRPPRPSPFWLSLTENRQ